MINKKRRTLLTPTDKTGLLFVLPFIIGFIWLFFLPLLESLEYTFNRISVDSNGLVLEPIGFENWKYMIEQDATLIKRLWTHTTTIVVQVLVIMFMEQQGLIPKLV